MAFQKDASLFSFFGFFPFIFLYEIEKYSNLFLIGKVPNKSLEFFFIVEALLCWVDKAVISARDVAAPEMFNHKRGTKNFSNFLLEYRGIKNPRKVTAFHFYST